MNTKKSRKRTLLTNGCSCSKISVSPSNWDKTGASVKKDWFIFYRFKDPEFLEKYPTGKLCIVKGMNEYKTLQERRELTKSLLKNETDLIVLKGYNPITDKFMIDFDNPVIETEIPTNTPLVNALDWALSKKQATTPTITCIRSVKNSFNKSAKQLRFDGLPIEKLKRSHVLIILDQIGKNKKSKWTANNFNFHKSHLSMLFELLIERCIMEHNPCDKIKKKKHVVKKRKIMSPEEAQLIDEHLRKNDFRLWLLMHIFFRSGSRRTEFVTLKRSNVDLKNQIFTATVKKGNGYRTVDYTITNDALYYWEIALHGCKEDDFIFSRALKPGPLQILPEYITKRWKREVKDKLNINVDWYALKHLHTTKVSDKYGIGMAASFNNESERMIKSHYDVNYKDRNTGLKKNIDVTLY